VRSPVNPTRRHILRGAGVALALPWLESLAPRPARGQGIPLAPKRRFVSMFFPMGTADYWRPTGSSSGWQLSPILAPLAPLKSRVTVLGHVSNTAYGPQPPAHHYALMTGSFLTCVPGQSQPLKNGLSVDQRAAALLGNSTPIPSLQLGLSTLDSSADSENPAFSRSISWRSPTEPLFKMVSPQAVFDRLVGGQNAVQPTFDPGQQRRRARQSVLDFVLANANGLRPTLSTNDRLRVDRFLTSVRSLEQRVTTPVLPPGPQCSIGTRPGLVAAPGSVPSDYDRDRHASIMIDLIVMALACDLSRVVSFMLDDGRSDFVYDFLTERRFTAAGSTPGTASVGGYRGVTNAGATNNGYATIGFWFVSKLAELCQKLAAVPDGPNQSLLDSSLVWFGSGEHDGHVTTPELPLLYVGSGGGVLRTDRYHDFPAGQRLSNVYLTFLRHVFGAPDAAFGDSDGALTDLLA
jgi:hypothetical protein